MALKRCRRMTIDVSETSGYLARIQVFDPRRNGSCISEYLARHAMDTERIKRAWMSKFQVPPELITVKHEGIPVSDNAETDIIEDKPPEGKSGGKENADEIERSTS